MVQYLSSIWGARDFIVIDNIDEIAIVGDAASTRKRPNVDIIYINRKNIFNNKLNKLQNLNYEIIFESKRTVHKLNNEIFDKYIKLIEQRFNE